MKRSRRKENILRRWAWGVRWCSKLWVGLWVEAFGGTPGNLLKRMVGLGGLEPPTSPLSGARSSHLSYRPGEASEETTHISLSLRCLSFVCNCVQILKLRWPRFFGHRWRSRAPNARSGSGFSSIQIQYFESGGQFGHHCHLYGKGFP